jgi:hypothetical protein
VTTAHGEEDIHEIRITAGMTPEEIRDAEYRALVVGQKTLIKQLLEVSKAQKQMEKRYDKQLLDISVELGKNTSATNTVKIDTADLVGAINAIKGGMIVLGWLGKFAKPIAIVSIASAVVISVWHGLEDWVKAIIHNGPPPPPPPPSTQIPPIP